MDREIVRAGYEKGVGGCISASGVFYQARAVPSGICTGKKGAAEGIISLSGRSQEGSSGG